MGAIIYCVGVFAVGFFARDILGWIKSDRNHIEKELEDIYPCIVHIDHLEPKYYGFHENDRRVYWETVHCHDCDLVGLREDLSPSQPCLKCGGTVSSAGVPAKWGEKDNFKQWITKKEPWE